MSDAIRLPDRYHDSKYYYSIRFIGLDDTTDMSYLDSAYADKVGSLKVSISTLDAIVPAAAWLFATALRGLVGFGKQRKTA